MEKIFITTQTGQKVEVGVVRLFKYNESVFFIYTLSEKDASNYVKLYVTKVNMSNLQSVVITDENEWASFKDVMKTIIKNNRNNAPLEVVDLDAKVIENITVYDPKVFKLSEEMTNFLQMNINLSTNVGEVAPAVSPSAIPDVFSASVSTPAVNSSQPVVNDVVNTESLLGDISANPEPAGVVETNATPEVKVPNVTDIQSTVDVSNSEPTLVADDFNITESTTVSDESVETSNDDIGAANIEAQSIVSDSNESLPSIEVSVPSEVDTVVGDVVDYKVAYLEEQLKVETLNTKIATLEAEIKLLEQKIEQVKKVIE